MTSTSVCAASSRDPSRKVMVRPLFSSSTLMTVPWAAWPSAEGGEPICAWSSIWRSWRIRASFLPCSSFAAW